MNKSKEICYYCGAEAISKEHVPPLCFFPKRQRNNLITVPACANHNKSLADDQEYVRNMITMNFTNNSEGFKLADDKGFEGIKRSQKDINKSSNIVFVNNIQTLSINLDMEKTESVFKGMGYALYFHNFNKIFSGNWIVIYNNHYWGINNYKQDAIRAYNCTMDILNHTQYSKLKTANPEIFKYYVKEEKEYISFKLIFYEGYIVYLLGKYNV